MSTIIFVFPVQVAAANVSARLYVLPVVQGSSLNKLGLSQEGILPPLPSTASLVFLPAPPA
jgi:hypothetical protein